MIRVILDTNLLVSYLVTHRPPIATLLDEHLAREDIALVTAPALLEELDRVLRYPRLQRYYTDAERTRFVALSAAVSEVVELPEPLPRICRDPDDDRVIACAVVGQANAIVTGDQDLLALAQVGGIPIRTAADLIVFIERQEGAGHPE